VKGVASFAVSPVADRPFLAAFTPEAKGQPASAAVVDAASADGAVVSRRSFYRATGAEALWNSTATACLFLATSDTDATNQSYYGESKVGLVWFGLVSGCLVFIVVGAVLCCFLCFLMCVRVCVCGWGFDSPPRHFYTHTYTQLHYLPADPSRADAAAAVPLPKDGPVHDVQWAPDGGHFVVVAGFMPAKVTLFDAACRPVYDLGGGPFNFAAWSPFGRFLAIAGFGNLPGARPLLLLPPRRALFASFLNS
jgi:translation initiation factor 2A